MSTGLKHEGTSSNTVMPVHPNDVQSAIATAITYPKLSLSSSLSSVDSVQPLAYHLGD